MNLLEFFLSLMILRELWRQEATVEQSLQNLREECRRVEQNLRSCFSKVRVFRAGFCGGVVIQDNIL